MGNFVREMEMIRKNQMEMPEMRDTVTDMMNADSRLISKLDTVKERIIEHENLQEITQSRACAHTCVHTHEKMKEKLNRAYKICETVSESITYVQITIPGRKERKRQKNILKNNA